MKRVTIIAIVSMIIITAIVFYLRGGGVIINADIQVNKLSAKELIGVAKPYVDMYWGNKKYYVGEISMNLDKNLEGKVKIWYKDDIKDKKGVPSIITLEIDTKEKKILSITKQVRNTKIVPGDIDIVNWSVDSDDAIDIARKALEDLKDFDFTRVYLSGNDLSKGGKETWDLSLYNDKNKNAYFIKIDAYSGEIYKKEVK